MDNRRNYRNPDYGTSIIIYKLLFRAVYRTQPVQNTGAQEANKWYNGRSWGTCTRILGAQRIIITSPGRVSVVLPVLRYICQAASRPAIQSAVQPSSQPAEQRRLAKRDNNINSQPEFVHLREWKYGQRPTNTLKCGKEYFTFFTIKIRISSCVAGMAGGRRRRWMMVSAL